MNITDNGLHIWQVYSTKFNCISSIPKFPKRIPPRSCSFPRRLQAIEWTELIHFSPLSLFLFLFYCVVVKKCLPYRILEHTIYLNQYISILALNSALLYSWGMKEKKENSPIRYAAKMLYTYIWQNIFWKKSNTNIKRCSLGRSEVYTLYNEQLLKWNK